MGHYSAVNRPCFGTAFVSGVHLRSLKLLTRGGSLGFETVWMKVGPVQLNITLLVEMMWLFSFIEWNQWIEVEVSTNNVVYKSASSTTNEGKEGGGKKRKGFGARTNTSARAVNSPESCISRGVMEGWSRANTNTGLAREDLHRWARFPPFQFPSPVVPSAICCPPPYPPAAVNSWVCHSLEPLIMSNQSLLYLFIYLYTVWSQVSSLRRRLLPSKHAHGLLQGFSRDFASGSGFTLNIKRWPFSNV